MNPVVEGEVEHANQVILQDLNLADFPGKSASSEEQPPETGEVKEKNNLEESLPGESFRVIGRGILSESLSPPAMH